MPTQKTSTTKIDQADRQRNNNLQGLMFHQHYKITLRVVIFTVLPVVILGGLGYLADGALQTRPLFMLLGLVIAFIAAQVLNFIVMKRLTDKQ